MLGIEAGTELLEVNGREVTDFLDWEFLTADDAFVVRARAPDGTSIEYDVVRPDDSTPMGVELEPPVVRRCANRCDFCFVEGLPPGLRKSLYIRDDDYRLSFAYGNFATLSNLRERDYQRIVEYRLSPLYVSVHATPWEVRSALLNNPRLPDIVEQLTRLAAAGIQFHAQIVVVPGVNDGAVLEKTLADLWALGDAVLTVAIVPVGTTQFSHLYSGKSMCRDEARALIQHADGWSARAVIERGTAWVTGSDELYLLAEQPLPGPERYGDFPQVENGVGAVTYLRQRVRDGLASLRRHDGVRFGVLTGVAMAEILPGILDPLAERTGARFELIRATNSLFGATITTAGLLTAADIERSLHGRTDLDLVLIPAETLNDDAKFLDDRAFDDLRRAMPMPILASYDFIDVLSREPAVAFQP